MNRAFSAGGYFILQIPGALPQVRHGESILWRTGDETSAFGVKHKVPRGGAVSLRFHWCYCFVGHIIPSPRIMALEAARACTDIYAASSFACLAVAVRRRVIRISSFNGHPRNPWSSENPNLLRKLGPDFLQYTNERPEMIPSKREIKEGETIEKKGNRNPNQRKTEEKMKKLYLVLIGLVASLAIGTSTARAQQYSLQDLGVVQGMEYSEVAAINNQGHVAGTAYKGRETCAFHYSYKFMVDAGGFNSRGFGISSTNLVVGDNFFFTSVMAKSHAAIFKGGVAVDLGVLNGQPFSRANGINANMQVVGFSGPERDSDNSRAFLWTSQGGMVDIGTLGGSYAKAYAINDAGYVTGTAQTGATVVTTHAFIFGAPSNEQAMRDLGVLGGHSSYGLAINRYNHVAGYSTLKANSERVHAFLHDGNHMIDLGSLGGEGLETDVSVALGVNSRDQVVGYSFLPGVGDIPLQQVAFLWTRKSATTGAGKMVNLNKLINGTGKYLLVSATGINDDGQIVATAYGIRDGGVHAVLLTPMSPTF